MKAILFDFDGTLANTMKDNFNAWKKAFIPYVEIKYDDYYPIEGASLPEVVQSISNKYNLKCIDTNEIILDKEKSYLANCKHEFYKGSLELLQKLVLCGKMIGLVTSARLDRSKKTTPTWFLPYFDVVITGDLCKGKPAPDMYLTACSKLEVLPEDCIVVENAPYGIQSAKNAGMYCIAIQTTLDKSYLNEADKIVTSFEELQDILLSMVQK
jgi:beta-phosphoglucomutase